MSSDRRMKGILCVTAWIAVGVLVLNAVAGGHGSTVPTAGAATATSPPAPPAKAILGSDGRVVAYEVDPPDPAAGTRVRHPLTLMVQTYGINGTPLVTSTTPTGYSPTTVKKYLGLTGTGSGITIAIVVAYNAPTIAADLATFDQTYGLPAPYSFKKVSQAGSTTSLPV